MIGYTKIDKLSINHENYHKMEGVQKIYNQDYKKVGKDFWGPPFWEMFHILGVTIQCTKKGKEKFEQLLRLFCQLVPCPSCCAHLNRNLKAFPPGKYLTTNEDAFFYTYVLHDIVNDQVNEINKSLSENERKPIKVSPDYEQIRDYYFREWKNLWGKAWWKVIHCLGATFKPTKEHAQKFTEFLNLLCDIMPCQISCSYFRKALIDYPVAPYLLNNHDAFFYTYILHNVINEKINEDIDKMNGYTLVNGIHIKTIKFYKKSPNYDEVKSYYFRALVGGCKDCDVKKVLK